MFSAEGIGSAPAALGPKTAARIEPALPPLAPGGRGGRAKPSSNFQLNDNEIMKITQDYELINFHLEIMHTQLN